MLPRVAYAMQMSLVSPTASIFRYLQEDMAPDTVVYNMLYKRVHKYVLYLGAS